MDVARFDFSLPPSAIALRPARPRDAAKLLHLTPAGPADRHIRDLPELLAPGDLLVLNDTRVLPVQLTARRGRGRVELTLLQPIGDGRWQAFARPARRLRAGDVLHIARDFTASVLGPHDQGRITLDFAMANEDLLTALHQYGVMPLPPYIRKQRAVDDRDSGDYQTVVARRDGAVAAPTAGLHFTEALLAALAEGGVERADLTLHVGPGTFLPVSADDTDDHHMHAEWGEIRPATAERVNAARQRGGRVVAVGSTCLRLLESAADEGGTVRPFAGETDIFITPGYRFRAVDMMLTNFHLPRSTLFMLVAAFAGLERMRAAYAHAIAHGYRFYSYGDACLLHREGA
ncbi:MAG: tRNA preQ1(34) S-adenosylmethionine ribosyltransferase-isomerase QueA [Alphaproteobacteria bacterium]|jgi:S-adenosylmethionine:tRNA ribosyltransferase-isomerase|nr:tRNA preQ1(34) S-adenosylmethionine ribosyltransferase-isomerase QueA [Alphaproteobacteria bacterium]MDP6565978.1 tRNA preQ1(34) S-adenosylmethionine ribosyltransferase-isomerase QueA [Alphaproteobacteria bacterium]MDP6812985.1 tRNA preQ1(34) S-adenosylmethionine ribosyltransferase-isomerase QueA [Alphaproteobacteria bacterium]